MTLSASSVKKKIEVDGDYIYITVYRGLGYEREQCRYQLKVEGEGLVIDAIEDVDGVDELVSIDAIDHEWEEAQCPECSDSEVCGRIYNNNDSTSGQCFNCQTCNSDGDLGSDFPDYDPAGI